MNDAEAEDLLETMVRIESLSGDEGRLATELARIMNENGFNASVDGAGNTVGVIGSGPVHGVLLGHIDTVPGVVPVERRGRQLYGRGTVDAKGPFAAFIVAAARIAKARPDALRLTVIGCVEEEAPTSRGARFAAEHYPAPDFVVVGEPSGWDAMTIGYKGYLRTRVEFSRAAAHTAHEGDSASALACRAWVEVQRAAEAFNAGRERLFDRIMPALVSIQGGGDGLLETATMEINLRLPPELPPDDALSWLAEIADGADVQGFGGAPAWSGPRTTPLHRAFARGIAGQGGKARYLLKTGTADSNIVAPRWGCPALVYGPGDASLDHTPNEHVDLDEFLRGISVLEQALTTTATSFTDSGFLRA